MPERLLLDLATRCNLRCPMCLVWGAEDDAAVGQVAGVMALEKARKILGEVAASRPMVAPSIYGEPLLIPGMRAIFADMKRLGLPVVINTNGLTLSEETARFFVEIGIDSVMFSIDATSPETLRQVRGIDKLAKVEAAVFRMLKARGRAEYPRVGVSFTAQADNRHELEAFKRRWVGAVDVVRIGEVFEAGAYPAIAAPAERKPCGAIYQSMAIHNDGSVRICCLDGMRATSMGNVLETSVAEVWHGEAFSAARAAHEAGDWDAVPFCKPCNGWARFDYEEEIRDGILIRRSPEFEYFNRIDRLAAWKTRGGHELRVAA